MYESFILSLPQEILDKIAETVNSESYHDDDWLQSYSRPQFFARFYNNRQKKLTNEYDVRLVCKRFDDTFSKFLFSEVVLRPGWNFLFTNPPLREMATGLRGEVFRANTKTLKIRLPVKEHADWEELPRDHPETLCLTPEVWYHYPEPLNAEEIRRKYSQLVWDIREWLPAAMSAMKKLVEVDCTVDGSPSHLWLYSVIARGLVQSQRVSSCKIVMKTYAFPGPIIPSSTSSPLALADLTGGIGGVSTLQTLEFTCPTHWALPIDLDDLWTSMRSTGVKLRELSVDALSMGLLEYLASFIGLEALKLSPAEAAATHLGKEDHRILADYWTIYVIKKHASSLQRLVLPCTKTDVAQCWSVNGDIMTGLQACKLLSSLTVSSWIKNTDEHNVLEEQFRNILEAVQTLTPSLNSLSLTLVSILEWETGRLQEVLHRTITATSLYKPLPSSLEISRHLQYSTPDTIKYAIVESHNPLGESEWTYHADLSTLPAWWNQPFRCGGCFGIDVDDWEEERNEAIRKCTEERKQYITEQMAKGISPVRFE